MPREIQQFFEAYRAAFNALDGSAIAELYAEPSAIAQGGNLTIWSNRSAIAANMVALCGMYKQRGYTHAEYVPVQFVAQGAEYAFAHLRWSISWAPATEPWVFNTSYNLVRKPEGWRVVLCTAYAEDKLLQVQRAA